MSGQKVACECGIRFEVLRNDVTRPSRPSLVAMAAPPNGNGTGAGAATGTAQAAVTQVPLGGVGSDIGTDKTITPSKQHPIPAEATQEAKILSVMIAPDLPGYELLELLGKGGMGEVWRARQKSLDRVVAVKLLPPKFAADREFVARFEKEATALAVLSHPNIIQIYDRGVAGQHYFFAMELVPGKSLRDLLNQGRPPPVQALRLAVQIARAVDHAHEQNVVHRDLKPENILVDGKGHVKVADFGLAGMRGSERDLKLTATSVAMGTINYMAPEQRRDAKHVDHRADLYSFGVMLYELLTGELPIGRFKLPSEKVEGLDPRLDEVVGQLLEPDPAHRPGKAGDVAVKLEEVIPHSSASVAPPRPSTPSRVPFQSPPSVVRSRRAGLWIGALVVLALGAVGAAVKLWPQSPNGPPSQPPQWYGDVEDELWTTGKATPDGVLLNFGGNGDQEINVHSGLWKFEDGALLAIQYGPATKKDEHPAVVPRMYVAHRYYSADQFDAEVEMEEKPLSAEFPPLAGDAQRFGELSLRIKDLQVSAFAYPGLGMRLAWRYFTPDGTEVLGNSARDQADGIGDEMAVPEGKFKLRLKLDKNKNGSVDAHAFVNGQAFAHKSFVGLAGQVGKAALGCRNLVCRFTRLSINAKEAPRPKKTAIE